MAQNPENEAVDTHLNSISASVLKNTKLISTGQVVSLYDRYNIDYHPQNESEYKLAVIIHALESEIYEARQELKDCQDRCRTLQDGL